MKAYPNMSAISISTTIFNKLSKTNTNIGFLSNPDIVFFRRNTSKMGKLRVKE